MNKATLLLLALSLCSVTAQSETYEPKWEIGAGLGTQVLADYRGSEHYRAYALPIPYLVYHGDFIRADDEGLRGLFIDTENFELDISADAALNGNSEDNPLRQGMEELESAFELGPQANFNLTGEDFSEGWSFRLPIRAVFAASFEKIEHIGYLANPKLTYESLDWNDWDGSLNVGMLYGSDQYHDYYYSVAPQFATPDRPAYDASSGYSASYFKLSFSKRSGRLWYGTYLRYDYLEGTAFADSPLMETDHYATVGLGISWIFAQSKERVLTKDP